MSRAYDVVAAVADPELQVVTIEDLGILRDVAEDPATGRVTVTITPTYTGCPAMDTIRDEIRGALGRAGYSDVDIVTVLRPAWTTDMITERGRARLADAGIAPPPPAGLLQVSVRCPQCGSPDTQEITRFGSTACKALWRCRACGEPFEHVKRL